MAGLDLNQTIALLVCWMVALIFAVAAKHKVFSWVRFRASFAAYDLVPEALVSPVAGGLAVAEVLVVIGCLLAQPLALLAGAGLFLIYAIAMGLNLRRGRSFIDCGCGDEPTPLGIGLLLRNCALCGLAVGAAGGLPELGNAGAFVVIAGIGAAIAYGIYAAIDQLLANRGRHRRLWLGVS